MHRVSQVCAYDGPVRKRAIPGRDPKDRHRHLPARETQGGSNVELVQREDTRRDRQQAAPVRCDDRDLVVVQGIVLLLVFAVLVINLLTDLSYLLIDPRLRSRDAT